MNVAELMTPNAHYCTTHQNGADAARAMWDFDIGCVPVIDDKMTLVGMVTDRDLCMAAYTRGQAPHEIPLAEIMSTNLAVCKASDPLTEAELSMRARQVRRLPVVDDGGHLVGMLSLNDIALAARSPVARAKQRLFGDIDETLAAISRHRPAPVGMQV